MNNKIIRIVKTKERPAYVKGNITKEIRPIIGNEFKGENIIYYKRLDYSYKVLDR